MTALRGFLVVAAVVAVAACSGPILANPPAQQDVHVAPSQPPVAVSDPLPVELPRDDGPHDRLTEWWYYTGHLRDDAGGRWGFEFVIFRAERGGFPVSWASHLALTDETGDAFHYSQRAEIGPQVDRSPLDAAGDATWFDLSIIGADPERPETLAQPPWTMTGADGSDRLAATLSDEEATVAGLDGGLTLELDIAATKPAALHDTDGWIDFGPAGGSYYYSRTSMTASGSLVLGDRRLDVEGSAWFDHQWGDFIAVGGGGWDWFAVNLDDGTDLTLSFVRDENGNYPLVYGTLVDAAGEARHLPAPDFTVDVTGHWTSPHTSAEYQAGWVIDVPGEDLRIELEPTVADQELDTRPTTGVIYWEGSQVVRATHDGRTVGGDAYVEMTGYAAALAGQ
jgi:predicted secreted hydrolase